MPVPKGVRIGGRQKGTVNKRTLEKRVIEAEIARRTLADAKAEGRKLAKEVLEELMHVFLEAAMMFKPAFRKLAKGQKSDANEERFQIYSRLTKECATALAPFQSPTFKAVAVTPAMMTGKDGLDNGDFAGREPVRYPTIAEIKRDLAARGLPPLRDLLDAETIEEILADDDTNGKVKTRD